MARARFLQISACLSWLFAAASGLVAILTYQGTAGSAGKTPQRWPAEMRITLDANRPTLVLFAHPKCPCTRASIDELNRLLTQCPGRVATHVVFFAPGNIADDWTLSDSWKNAAAIPGVVVEIDRNGKKAHRFGAETSGHVVLYNPRGELLFEGGITAGRGHAGGNAGANAIFSLLLANEANTPQTPVFGCSLLNPNKLSKEETTSCTS